MWTIYASGYDQKYFYEGLVITKTTLLCEVSTAYASCCRWNGILFSSHITFTSLCSFLICPALGTMKAVLVLFFFHRKANSNVALQHINALASLTFIYRSSRKWCDFAYPCSHFSSTNLADHCINCSPLESFFAFRGDEDDNNIARLARSAI